MFQDEHIRWVQEAIGLGHPLPFEIVSLLGDTWGVLLAVGLGYWLYGREPAFTTALAVAVAAPLWYALATAFAVPRPAGSGIVVYGDLAAGSFPSGHVFHAAVAWGTLAATTPVPLAVPALAAIATGVARVYLGVHYPVDVVASLVLAPAFVWILLRVARRAAAVVSPRARALALAALPAAAVAAFLLGVRPERLRRAEIAGMILAGPVAILLSTHRPRPASLRSPPVIGAGVAGLMGLAMVSRLLGPGRLWLAAGATAAAFLWTLVVLPEVRGAGGSEGE